MVSDPDGHPVVVVLSTDDQTVDVALPGNAVSRGFYVDVLSGERISIGVDGSDATVSVEPLTARVLVAETDPCR